MYLFFLFIHDKLKPIILLTVVFVTCATFATGWTVTSNLIYASLYPKFWTDAHISLYFMGLINSLFILLCWSGTYYSLSYYYKNQLNKQKMVELKSEAQEAKLRMLRYQLNPHFLFNTLNSISCLIKEQDNLSADKMLTRLAELLRFTLDSSPIDMVTVDEELELADRYLQIEKIRFQEKLNIELAIEDGCKSILIPSLLLQPLIENSLKHAISKNSMGGTIKISLVTDDQHLNISISDDGGLSESPSKNGLGLKNLNSRLQSIYESDYQLDYGQSDAGGFEVNIKLPIHREED